MRRSLRYLLIAFALLFAQQASQLHALQHSAGHPAAQCLAFHTADNALPSVAVTPDLPFAVPPGVAGFTLPISFPPRIEFDSRAPPALS